MEGKEIVVFGIFMCVLCATACDVRLAGGSNNYEGRVEIIYQGTWGTICDDSWSTNDANVVCRQLGYGRAAEAVGSAGFGQGSGTIWLDDLQCAGTEDSLDECRHAGMGRHNCQHSEDAGVRCTPLPVSCPAARGSMMINYPGRGDVGTISHFRSRQHTLLTGTIHTCDTVLHSGELDKTFQALSSLRVPGDVYVHEDASYTCQSGETMTAVLVYDLWADGTGGTPSIRAGSLSSCDITIRVTSQELRGFKSRYIVFGSLRE